MQLLIPEFSIRTGSLYQYAETNLSRCLSDSLSDMFIAQMWQFIFGVRFRIFVYRRFVLEIMVLDNLLLACRVNRDTMVIASDFMR